MDGFCSAWLCHQAWPDADYIAMNYGEPPPDVTDRDVMILDFSFKRPVMEVLGTKAKSLVVLDHHKTAESDLAVGLFLKCPANIIFDMAKSGAMLTWDYLNELFNTGLIECPPACLTLGDPHWIVRYIQDRDLWLWNLNSSKEINATLGSYPKDFKVWTDLSIYLDTKQAAIEGSAILRYQNQTVESQVKNAHSMKMFGVENIPVLNCTVLISEICGELAKGKPFAATYFDRDNLRIWSLRSDSNGMDVSELAKSVGGGGHKNASGFQEKI